MEASVVEQAQETEEGAPVEGAEATRTVEHLFEYSRYVHAGGGAEECEHREDGKCQDADHFHAWLCLPNTLQHRDIQEKARAAKARRKRALRDAGSADKPPSDAYVTLESELDDLMAGDRERVLEELADRKTREDFGQYVLDIKGEDRFSTYDQDAEEFRRMVAMPEDERPVEDFQQLDDRMTEFGNAIDERVKREREAEINSMRNLSEEEVRDLVRKARIAGEGQDTSVTTYYLWLAFVCTRKVPGGPGSKRYFYALEDFRSAPPEAVNVIDGAIRDLESRMVRGDAAGN